MPVQGGVVVKAVGVVDVDTINFLSENFLSVLFDGISVAEVCLDVFILSLVRPLTCKAYFVLELWPWQRYIFVFVVS